MITNMIEEFRAAAQAAEVLMDIECGRRIGRNAALLQNLADDCSDGDGALISRSLAMAFYLDGIGEGSDAAPDIEGCVAEFRKALTDVLERSGPHVRGSAVEAHTDTWHILEDLFERGCDIDYADLILPEGPDPLDDDALVLDDPSECTREHLEHLCAYDLGATHASISSILDSIGRYEPFDPCSVQDTAVVTIFRVFDRDSEGDNPEPSGTG